MFTIEKERVLIDKNYGKSTNQILVMERSIMKEN